MVRYLEDSCLCFFLTADQMLAKKNNTVESRGTYAFVIEVVNQLAEA